MGYTAEELQAIRTAVGSIAEDRIQRAGLYDPAGYIATALARYLAEHAEEWVDFASPKTPEDLERVVAQFIASERARPKPRRKERHLLEQAAAERSGYPSALKAALTLIRVEHGNAAAPRSVHLFSAWQKPGLYLVRYQRGDERLQLETLLPLSSGEFSQWEKWQTGPPKLRL